MYQACNRCCGCMTSFNFHKLQGCRSYFRVAGWVVVFDKHIYYSKNLTRSLPSLFFTSDWKLSYPYSIVSETMTHSCNHFILKKSLPFLNWEFQKAETNVAEQHGRNWVYVLNLVNACMYPAHHGKHAHQASMLSSMVLSFLFQCFFLLHW